MSSLAILAMALLLAMPIASRVMASSSGGTHATWSQLCTASGLKLVKTVDTSSVPDSELPTAPSIDHMDGDCPYCPLAAGMMALLFGLLLSLCFTPQRGIRNWRRDIARLFLHPNGLGSRGPPLLA
nr:DUF2946 family protein [Xanthomonas sp. A1809]